MWGAGPGQGPPCVPERGLGGGPAALPTVLSPLWARGPWRRTEGREPGPRWGLGVVQSLLKFMGRGSPFPQPWSAPHWAGGC